MFSPWAGGVGTRLGRGPVTLLVCAPNQLLCPPTAHTLPPASPPTLAHQKSLRLPPAVMAKPRPPHHRLSCGAHCPQPQDSERSWGDEGAPTWLSVPRRPLPASQGAESRARREKTVLIQDEGSSLRRMFTSDINTQATSRHLGFSKIWEGRPCGGDCRDFTLWPLWEQRQSQSGLWRLLGLCPHGGSGEEPAVRRRKQVSEEVVGSRAVNLLPPAPCPPAARLQRGGRGVESGEN